MLDIDPDREPATPRDAATVLLLREQDEGFSIFMVKRHSKSGFMAGAYVFPGGTLDAEDQAPAMLARVRGRSASEAAGQLGDDQPERALGLLVAALRETFEEAGVLLAHGAEALDLVEARARLNSGASFLSIVEELDLTLRGDALVPWSRWVTPEPERRRYDARFFLARVPRTQWAEHDRKEVTEGEWLTPAEALESSEQGRISLPPPTLRTVEQLSAFGSIDDAIGHVRGRVPKVVMPVIRPIENGIALTLPGDPEHPVGERAIEGPTRFVLLDGRFQSVDP